MISLQYGIYTGVILIIYFFLLGPLDLNQSPAYSLVNLIITGVGIFLAINTRRVNESDFVSKQGFSTGLWTGIYATILFTIIFVLYYAQNETFAENLRSGISESLGITEVSSFMLITAVIILGLVTTLIDNLIIMAFFKKSMASEGANLEG